MQVRTKDLERFAEWSGDHNPLHLDPDLARGTPFGQPIAHGILAVIEAFRSVSEQAVKSVKSLEIEFQGAVFPDGLYDVKSACDKNQLSISVRDGASTALIAKANFRNGEGPSPSQDLSWILKGDKDSTVLPNQKRSLPANRTVDDLHKGLELIGTYATDPPPESYATGSTLKPLELRVLGLCSYLVGMEVPGLRSLFTRLRLDINQAASSTDALLYRLRIVGLDKQFRILDTALEVATQAGEHVATGEIRSYVRFTPIVTDLDRLQSSLDSDLNNLKDKVALVCGGSRGLGADLSASLALSGCHVYVSYRKSSDSAQELKKRLEEKKVELNLIPGDAGDMEWCSSTLKSILKDHGRLDLVVLNACSPPMPMGINTELAPEFERYISQNLRLVQSPLAKFLPIISANRGSIVAVSSSFVEETPPDFGHYVALKQAVEGLMKSASREYPDIHFLIARPPRLQTSWNDTPTGVLGAIPADRAASCIVNRLNEGIGSSKVDLLSDFSQAASADTPIKDADDLEITDPDITVVISASFTADPLEKGLRFWFKELGLRGRALTAPYGQVLQELLNPSSSLSSNSKGISVVLLRLRDWLRELPAETTESIQKTRAYLTKMSDEFVRAMRTHRNHTPVETLLVICPSLVSIESDQDKALTDVQKNLGDQVQGIPGLQVILAEDFHPHYSVNAENIEDPLRNKIAHVPYQDGYLHVLSTIIARRMHRKISLPRKVVVLDCDNTIWNGVVGEVGAKGVKFEPVHRQLHELMTNLSQNGILICLCSKNEEADVWEVFKTRKDFALARDLVVAAMINWNAKSQNIQRLASRLNLGLDSFIFIDDNPVECAEVRAGCPEVLVLQWPQTTEECQKLLQHTWEFDILGGTKEDQKRTQLYRDEFQRQELKEEALSFKDFIANLELKVDIIDLNQEDLLRSSQLTLRTNQFNFTTRRRNENEVQQLIANENYICKTVRVRDRFGDYGLVGFLIVEKQDDLLLLDTFLLSCRVLGRGVEHCMAAELGRIGVETGIDTVRLRIETTKRNAPARKFLESIAAGKATIATEDVFECDFQSSYLSELRFEPAAKAEDDSKEKKAKSHKQSIKTENKDLRVREGQISRASSKFSTIADLQRAIDGIIDSGQSASVQDPADMEEDDVRDQVYLAFSNALEIPVDELKKVDQLEKLGCSSFKIVEITVALTAKYSWLPSTLLFEHRSISEIIAQISQILEAKAKEKLSGDPGIQHRASQKEEDSSSTDIAVVGLGVRCAEVNSPDDLWELISSGRSVVGPVPPERSPKGSRTYWAGLMTDINEFDAEFFGISPREAEFMDPQLRQLLEVAWEALEDAGATDTQQNPDTGVYVGFMYGDYVFRANTLANKPDSPYRCWEGFSLANRLSQVLGFGGPSFAVNTACSSSGTALHLACKGLRAGECSTAIVGGINLILDPDRITQLDRLGIISPSGKCCSFGADADGTVIGEGVGVVVLKPLTEAQHCGDRIYGVIKGSSLSTGTGTVGFTAPNPQAQAEAIRRSLQDAGIDPRTISCIEAHGTGTLLGDPIEIRGLTLAFTDKRLWDSRINGTNRCKISSIKPNIGHLEAGAGIIGLIKLMLQLQRGFLTPSLNSDKTNPQIAFDQIPFALQHTLEPWERPILEFEGAPKPFPRRAGLSSFGVGGANAHLIVEEAPSIPSSTDDTVEQPCQVLTLAARHKESLEKQASRFQNFLETSPEIELKDICYTTNVARKHFEHRLALVIDDRKRLIHSLQEYGAGEEPVGCLQGTVLPSAPVPKVAFLFTGQGSQYVGMGKRLYDSHPVFKGAMDQCSEILEPILDRSLLEIIFAEKDSADGALLDQTGYTQPALFAIEYSLSKLWESWGVLPEIVMGHSVGEIAALCIAGGLSLEDGLTLIAARGRLMQALPAGGGMTSVRADEAKVKEVITPFADRVSIAALNGPQQTVISGEKDALGNIATQFEDKGIKTKALTVSHAFHSHLMDPMIDEYKTVAQEISFHTPKIHFVSCVTGMPVTDEIKDPDYWVRQVRQPVQFTAGMATLQEQSVTTFVEVGPQPVLLGMGQSCFSNQEANWFPSLRKGADGWQTILGSVAKLYVQGVAIDWRAFGTPFHSKLVSIPTYPFKRRHYWIDIPKTSHLENNNAVVSNTTIDHLLQADNLEGFSDHVQRAVNLKPEEAAVLPKVFKALSLDKECEPPKAKLGENLYKVVWQKKNREKAKKPNNVRGLWIVFMDQGGFGRVLTKVLIEKGIQCISISPGVSFKHVDEWSFVINPKQAEHYGRLWKEVSSDGEPINGIVQLWGLDASPSKDLNLKELERSQKASTESALHLVQALVKTTTPMKPALWLITRGAIKTSDDLTDEIVSLSPTPLWGFGRGIALENADIWGGLIDISQNGEPTVEAEALSQELLHSDVEDQVALRGGVRYVPRLLVHDSNGSGDHSLSEEGAYLITGGLGALGLSVAQWLLSKGVKSLILTSRRGLKAPGAKDAVQSLEKQGAQVFVVPADISHEDDVKRLFAEIKHHKTPLRGVVHAAGLDAIVSLADMTLDELRGILAPKVKGGWLLHEQTLNMDLDMFICFSSMASVLGATGRAHYSAANAFLDGLAHHRRSQGLPALSINWGPWTGGGMANDAQLKRFEQMGNYGLDPKKALMALETILGHEESQIAIVEIDWPKFCGLYEARGPKPLISELKRGSRQNRPHFNRSNLRWIEQLQQMPLEQRPSELAELLRKEVAKTLGFTTSDEVRLDQGLFDMGLDSLIAVELTNRLKKRLEIPISALDFNQPNLTQLAIHLLGQINFEEPGKNPEDISAFKSIARDTSQSKWVDRLSETASSERPRELAKLLRKEVAKTLGFDNPEEIRFDQGLFEIGLDSLIAVELAKRLNERLGIPISAFNFSLPNLEELATDLLGQLTLSQPGGIIKVTPELEDEIFKFQEAAYPERKKEWIASRWRWMFLESAKRFAVDPKVWLYRDTDGVVAHQGAFPVKLKMGSDECITEWFVESMVLESHRSKAVGTMLLTKALEEVPFNLSLGQDEFMRAIQKKMGWKFICPLGNYFYALRPAAVLQQKLPRGPVSWGASAAISLTTGMKRMARRPPSHWKPEVRTLSHFGTEHDDLWRSVGQELTCAVVRDASFLNWKYVDQPGQNFERLEIRKEGQVAALAVVSIVDPSGPYHYRRAFIVDLVVRPSDHEAVWAILDAVRTFCITNQVDGIVFQLTCAALNDQITNFGFLSREPTRWLLISTEGVKKSIVKTLLEKDNWYLTMGDSDIDRPW